MQISFKNQVAIITGAASGIGLAIAHKLLNMEAQVIVFDINESTLHTEFDKYGEQARLVPIDVTDQQLVERAILDAITMFGKIGILVNCVGITGITNIMSHDVSTIDLRKVFDVNFMSSFYTSRTLLPHMVSNHYGR